MKEILKEMIKLKQLIGIYRNSNNTFGFLVGYVIAVDDDFFAFSMISDSGKDDGVIISPINDIIKIETCSKYLKKIEKLLADSNIGCSREVPDGSDLINSTLKMLKAEHTLLSIGLTSNYEENVEDTVGIIIETSHDICSIQIFNEYGLEDGFAYIEISKIRRIEYATEKETTLLKLIQMIDQ